MIRVRGMIELEVNDDLLSFLDVWDLHACVRFPSAEDAKRPDIGNVEFKLAYVIAGYRV